MRKIGSLILIAVLVAGITACRPGSTPLPTGSSSAGTVSTVSKPPFSYGDITGADWEEGDQILGGTVCDYLNKKYWNPGSLDWKIRDPLKYLVGSGMNWVRVGTTMQSFPELAETPVSEWQNLPWKLGYWSCREYAEQIMIEAEALGMHKCLFLFLSPEAAHASAQKAPPEWAGKTVDEMAAALQQYCYETAKYYKDKGIKVDIYELGNEIERGILELRPLEKVELPAGVNLLTDTEYMRTKVWTIEAQLLKACAAGVREADPEAVIGLHVAGVGYSPNEVLITGFFKAMIDFGVEFDIAGLSYYWSSPLAFSPRIPYFQFKAFNTMIDYLGKTLGKKVLIDEWAYPMAKYGAEALIKDDGYLYTPEGQAAWGRDFLKYCADNPYIIGSFYFYPDYYDGVSGGATVFLESCGLFIDQFTPGPILEEYRKASGR